MLKRRLLKLSLAVLIAFTAISAVVIAENEPNVGVLRVYQVQHPRQVAPSARVTFGIVVEYAIHNDTMIRATIFNGSLKNLGSDLWHSDPVSLCWGGDELWNATLTAPSQEGDWSLTVVAYYREGSLWKFYNDTDQGPGFMGITIKVAKLADLEVRIGVPAVPVTMGNSTEETASDGSVLFQRPVGSVYIIDVPRIISLENSTQLVFERWQDGNNATQRSLLLDGAMQITVIYRAQYLLRVNSVLSAYSQSTWYSPNSNVTLIVPNSAPASWPFGLLGLRYVFKGWSGAIHSSATTLNFTINHPTTITADFGLDYTTLVIPVIIGVGIVGGVIVGLARRWFPPSSSVAEEVGEEAEVKVSTEEGVAKFCDGCGKPVEEDWTHCTHCGKALGSSEPVQH